MLLSSAEIKDAISMAIGAAWSNKLRSFLTILGVMVGVCAVIAMASVIDGLNLAVENEIDEMGNNIIIVDRFGPGVDFDNLTEEERNRPFPTADEAQVIKDNCPSVDGVAPQNHYWAPGGNVAKYKNRKFTNLRYNGTWPDLLSVRNLDLATGRFFTPTDLQFRTHVCVIGHDISETLFESGDPLGKEIRVNGVPFEVIGVFAEAESNFGDDRENNLVTIPLSTYAKIHPWDEALTLEAKAVSRADLDQALEEITAALRVARRVPFSKPNNFHLATQEQYKDQFGSMIDTVYIVGIVITSVGLMVGGIGVMNIMLVSVTERTREIGVRKAIGAKRSNIILQFLTEAMSLAGLGGVIGVGLGVGFGLLLNSAFGFPVSLPVFWVLIGFGVSVTVGLVSGVYPAVKASRLDPIDALRYE